MKAPITQYAGNRPKSVSNTVCTSSTGLKLITINLKPGELRESLHQYIYIYL